MGGLPATITIRRCAPYGGCQSLKDPAITSAGNPICMVQDIQIYGQGQIDLFDRYAESICQCWNGGIVDVGRDGSVMTTSTKGMWAGVKTSSRENTSQRDQDDDDPFLF